MGLTARGREAERGVPVEYRQCRHLMKIHDACATLQAHEKDMLYREANDVSSTALLGCNVLSLDVAQDESPEILAARVEQFMNLLIV